MARAHLSRVVRQFRFPGHETALVLASPLGDIPQGWEVKSLGESSEHSFGSTPKSRYSKDNLRATQHSHSQWRNTGIRNHTNTTFQTAKYCIAIASIIMLSERRAG